MLSARSPGTPEKERGAPPPPSPMTESNQRWERCLPTWLIGGDADKRSKQNERTRSCQFVCIWGGGRTVANWCGIRF